MIQKAVVYRSLVSRSPIIRFAYWFGVALTIFTLCFGVAYAAISFLAIVGLGLAGSIQNYRRWEGAQLVPNFRAAQALAAIQCSVALTILTLVVVALLHGPSLMLLGLTAAAPALTLTLISYPSAFFSICIVGFILATTQQYFDFQIIADWFLANPFHIHEILGVVGLAASFVGYRLFYKHAIGKQDQCAANRSDPTNPDIVDVKQSASSSPSLMIRRGSFWRRACSIMSPLNIFQARKTAISLLLMCIVIAVCFHGRRGSDLYFGFSVGYAAMVVGCSPLILFMSQLPQAFERAWIIGTGNNRTETARQLLKLSAIQSAIVFVMILIAMTIVLPFTSQNHTNGLLVLLAAYGAGSMSLWIASISTRYWFPWGHGHGGFLLFLGLISLAAALTIPTIQKLLGQLNSSDHFATYFTLSIVGCVCFSLVMWQLCFTTAAYCVGREPTLME